MAQKNVDVSSIIQQKQQKIRYDMVNTIQYFVTFQTYSYISVLLTLNLFYIETTPLQN